MIRFHSIRSHLTLALGACGMAVALASVPHAAAERSGVLGAVVDGTSDSKSIAARKIYLEILTGPSDDASRQGVPLSYVTCTGTGLRSDDVPAAPTEYVVFPVEDKAAEIEVQ